MPYDEKSKPEMSEDAARKRKSEIARHHHLVLHGDGTYRVRDTDRGMQPMEPRDWDLLDKFTP